MRYLITSHVGMGNMVLRTPMFTAIKNLDPEAEIDVMANNRNGAVDIVEGDPLVRRTYKYDTRCSHGRKREAAEFIREQHYDVALLPLFGAPGWLQLTIYRAKIPKKVQLCLVPGNKFRERAVVMLLHRRVLFVPGLVGRHEIDINLDLVQALSNKPLERNYRTTVSYRPDEGVCRELGLPERYVCLQIGASAGSPTPKRWPGENFSALIELLSRQYPGLGIVTVGTQKEKELYIDPLVRKHPGIVNTAGRTDINQLCNVIKNGELAVTHDSGAMHLANALDVPLIALYGPTDYTRTRPLGENSVILRKDLACSPCMFGMGGGQEAEIDRTCPGKECMAGISVDEVMGCIQSILKA